MFLNMNHINLIIPQAGEKNKIKKKKKSRKQETKKFPKTSKI